LSKDEGRLPGGQSGAAAARVAISGTRPAARATESARQAIEKTLWVLTTQSSMAASTRRKN
jgi:hypothetical protein